jgi:phage portal protein BeeE
MAPNEGRGKLDLKPVEGGESPYLQQQNYSLAALAKRDAQADPFAPDTPALPAAEEPDDEDDDADPEKLAAMFAVELKAADLARAA